MYKTIEERIAARKASLRRYRKKNLSIVKARIESWRKLHPEKTRSYCQKYKSQHRQELRAKNRRYHSTHKDQIRKRRQLFRCANRESLNAKTSSWKKAHPDIVRSLFKSWSKHNPERIMEKDAARRARLLKAIPSWVDRKAIRAIYADARRHTKETGIQHHVDHRYPMKHHLLSGLHVPWNLQILTAQQNLSKGNRLIHIGQ